MLEKHKEEFKITEDEAIQYDRQIRLWGLDAQKRLRSSRILIAGMRGLACEVAKNLVLAGVRSVTILDNEPLTKEDGDSNFLAPRDQVGSNRAEACVDRLKQLNPMVEVSAESVDIMTKSEEYLTDFDILFVTGQNKDNLIKLNQLCRKQEVKFFAGDTFGFFGYSFMDLIEHEYTEEVTVSSSDASNVDVDAEEPKAKKAKTTNEKEETKETKMVKKTMNFTSLSDSLKVDWSEESYVKRLKRMDPSLFFLHVLYEFQSREGRDPRNFEEDIKLLYQLKDSVTKMYNLPEGKISDDLIDMAFAGQISPVAAVVGGVVSQEIIKVISNKDAPNANFFFFNPLETGGGIVETIV